MKYLPIFLLLLFFSCKEAPISTEESVTQPTVKFTERKTFKTDGVFADNEFNGGALDDFIQINDSTFQATISPENTPINRSPWFAFRLWADVERDILLEIKYTEHGHRYTPKLSSDGKKWTAIELENYKIDTTEKKAILNLHLTNEKLWLAAQEVISSEDTYRWMDSFLQLPYAKKKVIGESVLEKPIYSVEFNEGNRDKVLVLIGRQHPPEIPGGTIAFQAFVEEVLSETDLAKAFRQEFGMQIIPLLNPDGADLGFWRHNANGLDLNRDWQDFSQPETQAVRDYLTGQKDKKVCFGIDFHTSYSGPYLLVLDTINPIKTKGVISDWVKNIKQKSGNTDLDIRPRAQNLPYCYNWFVNEFGIEAVTYEEGDEIDRTIIRNRAKIYAETLMTVLLEKER